MIDYLLNSINLIIFFILYDLILVAVGLSREIKLRLRKKIAFKKFLKYKKWFDFKISISYFSFIFLFFVSSTLFSLKIISDPVYRNYIILIALLNLLLIPFILLHIRSVKYNKDLSFYYKYYRIIHYCFHNKDLLIEKKNDLDKIYKALKEEINHLNKEFSIFFKNFEEIENLKDTIQPINEIIFSYQEQLDHFDNQIISKFDESLKNYLNTGITTKIEFYEFKFIDSDTITNTIDTVTSYKNQMIITYSLNKIRHHEIVSLEQLMNLIMKLSLLKIKLSDEFIYESLNYASIQNKNINEFLILLINYNLITINLLCDYINPKDWAWVYDIPLSKLFNIEDSVKVFSSIIHTNASKSAFKILTTIESKFLNSLKKSLIIEQTENETRNMFVVYAKLFASDEHFNMRSIRYENLAIVLSQYFEGYSKNDQDAKTIQDIIRLQTFEENAIYIESVYDRIRKIHNPYFLNSVNILFIYTRCYHKVGNYLHYEKVIYHYSDFKKNLHLNELIVLDLLIISLIVIYEEDMNIVNSLYKIIISNNHIYKINLSSKDMKYETKLQVGKKLIKYLTINNVDTLNTFKKVINRVENGRLIFDKIINL